jgi:hypothetical protein
MVEVEPEMAEVETVRVVAVVEADAFIFSMPHCRGFQHLRRSLFPEEQKEEVVDRRLTEVPVFSLFRMRVLRRVSYLEARRIFTTRTWILAHAQVSHFLRLPLWG